MWINGSLGVILGEAADVISARDSTDDSGLEAVLLKALSVDEATLVIRAVPDAGKVVVGTIPLSVAISDVPAMIKPPEPEDENVEYSDGRTPVFEGEYTDATLEPDDMNREEDDDDPKIIDDCRVCDVSDSPEDLVVGSDNEDNGVDDDTNSKVSEVVIAEEGPPLSVVASVVTGIGADGIGVPEVVTVNNIVVDGISSVSGEVVNVSVCGVVSGINVVPELLFFVDELPVVTVAVPVLGVLSVTSGRIVVVVLVLGTVVVGGVVVVATIGVLPPSSG